VRYIIQFVFVMIILLFSSLASWYEGSELLNRPFEWKYSTPFSEMMNGEVVSKADIIQLDYFIYSLKFQPFYPLLMIMSILYLVYMSTYLLLRKNLKKFYLILGTTGIALLLLSAIANDFSSQGGQYVSQLFIALGIVNLLFAVGYLFKEHVNSKPIGHSS